MLPITDYLSAEMLLQVSLFPMPDTHENSSTMTEYHPLEPSAVVWSLIEAEGGLEGPTHSNMRHGLAIDGFNAVEVAP